MLHGVRPCTEPERRRGGHGVAAKALHRDPDKMTIPPKSDIIIPDAEIPPGGKSFWQVFES